MSSPAKDGLDKGFKQMFYEAELTIIRNANNNPVLSLTALRALRKAEQSDRISGYAHSHQVMQFNRIATKAKQRALKKIYKLVCISSQRHPACG